MSDPGKRRVERGDIIALMALAMALRLLALGYRPIHEVNDVAEYQRIADRLEAGQGFCEGVFDLPCTPLKFKTPLYPAFLVFAQKVLGRTGWAVPLVQHVLGLVIVALPLLIVSDLLPRRFAIAAALVLAIDPLSVVQGNTPLTEGLFVPLLAGAWLLTSWAARSGLPESDGRRVVALAAAAGAVTGLASLVRPVVQAVVVPAVPLLFRRSCRARALAFLAAFGLTVSPWVARNARVGIHGLSGGLGAVLLLDVAWHHVGGDPLSSDPMLERTWAAYGRQDKWTTAAVFTALHDAMARGRDAQDVDNQMGRLALAMIEKDPVGYVRACVKNCVHTLVDQPLSLIVPGATDVVSLADAKKLLGEGLGPALTVCVLWALPMLVLLPLALAGAWATWRARDASVGVIAAGGFMILVSTAMVTRSNPRYRLPVLPAIVVLAAVGAADVAARCSPHRRPPSS